MDVFGGSRILVHRIFFLSIRFFLLFETDYRDKIFGTASHDTKIYSENKTSRVKFWNFSTQMFFFLCLKNVNSRGESLDLDFRNVEKKSRAVREVVGLAGRDFWGNGDRTHVVFFFLVFISFPKFTDYDEVLLEWKNCPSGSEGFVEVSWTFFFISSLSTVVNNYN